jgi:hypothetical protein
MCLCARVYVAFGLCDCKHSLTLLSYHVPSSLLPATIFTVTGFRTHTPEALVETDHDPVWRVAKMFNLLIGPDSHDGILPMVQRLTDIESNVFLLDQFRHRHIDHTASAQGVAHVRHSAAATSAPPPNESYPYILAARGSGGPTFFAAAPATRLDFYRTTVVEDAPESLALDGFGVPTPAFQINRVQYGYDMSRWPMRAPLLHTFCAIGYWRCAAVMLDALKVEVDRVGEHGWTELHRAVAGAHPTCVALLLRHGANPKRLSHAKETPLQLLALVRHDWEATEPPAGPGRELQSQPKVEVAERLDRCQALLEWGEMWWRDGGKTHAEAEADRKALRDAAAKAAAEERKRQLEWEEAERKRNEYKPPPPRARFLCHQCAPGLTFTPDRLDRTQVTGLLVARSAPRNGYTDANAVLCRPPINPKDNTYTVVFKVVATGGSNSVLLGWGLPTLGLTDEEAYKSGCFVRASEGALYGLGVHGRPVHGRPRDTFKPSHSSQSVAIEKKNLVPIELLNHRRFEVDETLTLIYRPPVHELDLPGLIYGSRNGEPPHLYVSHAQWSCALNATPSNSNVHCALFSRSSSLHIRFSSVP